MENTTTERLGPNADGYARAASILSNGGLVAFPTETVYGLGADARNDRAVAAIFAAKNRPVFNPLIVHVATIEQATRFVVWSDAAQKISDAFWPGPLTLVLPLKSDSGLSKLVTANLPTLAIRIPAHPVARNLLTVFNGPVAAPSANLSGRISPTTAAHVAHGLDGRIDAILDAGPCDVGLESTILGLPATPMLLREGGVTASQLEGVLGHTLIERDASSPLSAPGQMASHYAPNAAIRLNATTQRNGEVFLGFGHVDCTLNLSKSGDLTEAAANLFRHLHTLDAMGGRTIAVSPIPETGIGRAINDRLKRAAAPRD